MKSCSSVMLTTLAVVGLAGCNDDNPRPLAARSPAAIPDRPTSPPIKTVSWFIDHRGDLQTILKECRDNPGLLAKTPDCVNANEARNRVTVQEMKDALK